MIESQEESDGQDQSGNNDPARRLESGAPDSADASSSSNDGSNDEQPNSTAPYGWVVESAVPSMSYDLLSWQKLALERDEVDHQLRLKKEALENLQAIRKMRADYAGNIYKLAKWWLRGVMGILILSGFKPGIEFLGGTVLPLKFHIDSFSLDNSVLIALLGATGGLGLVAIILRNLFPSAESEKKKAEEAK